MEFGYTYRETYHQSQQHNWRVDDLISSDKRLDFARPFLPEGLARCHSLAFLSQREQLMLNHIRAHGYLYLFGVVEEFIVPFVLERTKNEPADDLWRTRALLGFAAEEAKHIQLFRRFRQEFEAGFGSGLEVVGPPEAIAQHVLNHDPLAVALVVLHIEWMTQRHYLESVRDDQNLDPQFKSLLKHHYVEEVQHAKLDTLLVADLAAGYAAGDLERSLEDYLKIGAFLDGGLEQQSRFDELALQRTMGRTLPESQAKTLRGVQHQALRWTFLGSGMTHPRVLEVFGALGARARERVEALAPTFC